VVKFLEDVGYQGSRHFDAHAYRTEDYRGVLDFARGCMRTYLILRERARQWRADREIQDLIASLTAGEAPSLVRYSTESRDALLGTAFDRAELARRGLAYERLDQMTMDVLLGAR
jgi:xylose isomerase